MVNGETSSFWFAIACRRESRKARRQTFFRKLKPDQKIILVMVALDIMIRTLKIGRKSVDENDNGRGESENAKTLFYFIYVESKFSKYLY